MRVQRLGASALLLQSHQWRCHDPRREGVEASSIQAAVISAMEAVEELRAQDSSDPDERRGWWLEIVDASGEAVQTIPLDALSHH
ncbi:DUF6894 family protein [Microvirga sp. P5_D2]